MISVTAMERISGNSKVVIERVPKKQKYVDRIRYDGVGLSHHFLKPMPFHERNKLRGLLVKLFRRS